MKPVDPTSTPRRDAFSLIELLVVIAVLAVLATVTLMSVNSTGGAARLTTAGNQTVDVINHARQYAQARNTLTMVAVARSGDDAGRVLGGFAFVATNGAAGTWTQMDRWRTLPESVAIDVGASPSNALGDPMASVPTLSRSGTTIDCAAITFLPDGRPWTTNAASIIELRPSLGTGSNSYKILINQGTGTPIIRRP